MRLAFASALTMLSSLAFGQADSAKQAKVRVVGIYDSRTGEPLQGVEVVDVLTGTFASTTATGTAALAFIAYRGSGAVVELRKVGYQAKQLVLNRADTIPITEVLEPVAALPAIVTTETYRIVIDRALRDGFDQRCGQRTTTCFRPDDLLSNASQNLADLGSRANGVSVPACAGGTLRGGRIIGAAADRVCGVITMRNLKPDRSPFCQPTFFVDGFEWDAAMGAPMDLAPGKPSAAPYSTSSVVGVEVYASDAPRPSRFEGKLGCGAIVLWTK